MTGEKRRAAELGGRPLTKLGKELLGSGLERESVRDSNYRKRRENQTDSADLIGHRFEI